MALLVNIDTATETASVSVTLNGNSLGFLSNEHQREHASFVHTAIKSVLSTCGYALNDVDAIAVTSGPGSYTGLRVGMATAKGFCYALGKPLITVNTLEAMTRAAFDVVDGEEDLLYCPMIDARRMEVFAALYNKQFEVLLPPAPFILTDATFKERFNISNTIVFFGSGSYKFKDIGVQSNWQFAEVHYNANHLGSLADISFQQKKFADVSYSEPEYFKEFYTNSQNLKTI